MNVIFRVDAGLSIGTGHVMRCLTLADALKVRGKNCVFVCREHAGNLLNLIRSRGFDAVGLPLEIHHEFVENDEDSEYVTWLGGDWITDVEQTHAAMGSRTIDWLIVDHYAIDVKWESAIRASCRRLMIVDDLANREHDCDLLLDQNLGRVAQDYIDLVPDVCEVLAGPEYALLREEFSLLRGYSLQRRQFPELRKVLLSMGGVDQCDATSQVLEALKKCSLSRNLNITVVMGPHAPWLERVRSIASKMPFPTSVLVNVVNMAKLMAESDLAIGAAGSTSWERCCLGLPTLMVVLAENQLVGATALQKIQAVSLIGNVDDIKEKLPLEMRLMENSERLRSMSRASDAVTDGLGIQKVLKSLGGY